MKKISTLITTSLALFIFSSGLFAAEPVQIAVVNVTELFNTSSYVQKANQKLQENVKAMQTKIESAQKKLQTMINNYEKSPAGAKRNSLGNDIKEEQSKLNTMTQNFQQKIQEEQNKGMQTFAELVRTAVQKVATEKHINTVLNSSSIVYSDNNGWMDITKDVAAVMPKE